MYVSVARLLDQLQDVIGGREIILKKGYCGLFMDECVCWDTREYKTAKLR